MYVFLNGVYSFAQAAVTKDRKLGGLNNTNVLSHSLEPRSLMEVLTGLVARWAVRGPPVPELFP